MERHTETEGERTARDRLSGRRDDGRTAVETGHGNPIDAAFDARSARFANGLRSVGRGPGETTGKRTHLLRNLR